MIIQGDCVKELAKLKANSVDSIVTDPPYGWRFMGKAWDAPDIAEMTKKRIHTRTAGKASIDGSIRKPREKAPEAAGTYDVSKAGNWNFMIWTQEWATEALRVLKPGGHVLVFCGPRTYHAMAMGVEQAGFEIRDQLQWLFGSGFPKSHNIGEGRGTALKPANEPIVLARKPLEKGLTIAENVLKWGTGALNIDGGRIESKPRKTGTKSFDDQSTGSGASLVGSSLTRQQEYDLKDQGRWPANVLFDESAAEMLDEQSEYVGMKNGIPGGASRFFYVCKTSKRERNAGLDGMPEKDPPGSKRSTPAEGRTSALGAPRANHHPTVKPIKLMEYLIKLITPPGGTVLDPFMGSGSTGCAAVKLGFKFIGIEREQEYIEIAKRRIEHWQSETMETEDKDQMEMTL